MPKLAKQLTRLGVFDTETSGVDVENDCVVTAFVGIYDYATDSLIEKREWIIDPGIEIPTGASDVHGYTTERIRAEGRKDVKDALFEIAMQLDIIDRTGTPMVIYNAPYDTTILDRELIRHWGSLRFRPPHYVLDPLVMWKKVERYRKGGRKLVDAAAAFGLPVEENAHDAQADCLMAGRVARKLLEHEWLRDLDVETITRRQIKHKRDQAESLESYFMREAGKISDPAERAAALEKAHVIPYWPIHPRPHEYGDGCKAEFCHELPDETIHRQENTPS